MARKTANVAVRVEPEVKEKAEAILDLLGIPVSVLINTLYRQIILTGGIPFSLTIPDPKEAEAALQQAEADTPAG